MHLEVLVEDKSGSTVIKHILDKIHKKYGGIFTFNVHPYKGLGKIPQNLKSSSDPNKRILLDQLPRILQGYGKSLQGYGAVVVVLDCDTKDCAGLKTELITVLERCNPAPETVFCIAIEEIEAWLLGDKEALKKAYPSYRKSVIDSYSQDSICGTWEVLADAVYKDKAAGLKKLGFAEVGREKNEWAENITPMLDVERNKSQSMNYFVKKIENLVKPA